ncbi:hypothetical protein B296_00040553 [Ensete ventricosum]|uniref:Uncharacterized protein n=1 Tax=Ensete ventricosum TaxID=4639 RepID=A0A426YBF8_ENSVE|nr:hypothetical protein B296_00040553 [Ensete ventricosum]
MYTRGSWTHRPNHYYETTLPSSALTFLCRLSGFGDHVDDSSETIDVAWDPQHPLLMMPELLRSQVEQRRHARIPEEPHVHHKPLHWSIVFSHEHWDMTSRDFILHALVTGSGQPLLESEHIDYK